LDFIRQKPEHGGMNLNPAQFLHLAPAFMQGLLLSAALIAALGAQNAFVLRQGLLNAHVGPVVALCAGMDALLIALGVLGAGWFAQRLPWLAPVLTVLGAVFLMGYGTLALRRAWLAQPGVLTPASDGRSSRRAALLQALAFTLLNPHVYLDTVLLVGSVGAQQPSLALQCSFVVGASSASAMWFSGLGYGARRLAPWLSKPSVWRGIDMAMGLLLIGLGMALLRQWR
jgi:L-lysine exporter family protein LysE/ArgO